MNMKNVARFLRIKAMSAPHNEISDRREDRAVFRCESITFSCLNSRSHIEALANRIEKFATKNFATAKLPRPATVRRESIRAVAKRFRREGDEYNATELEDMQISVAKITY